MSFLTRKPADSAGAGPDAGSIDTSALTHLREHDYGPSLMDRAQSQRQALAGIGAGTQTLLLQAATSTLPQEAQLAALDRQSAQLADAERTQAGYRRLRERYDPDELDRSLQQVGAIADPVQQRESLTRLQASYATFAFHPELARRIDAQFAEFEPVVQRREDASLRAAILAGRYAPTLADARQLYPGRKINTLMAPGSNVPVFVPERFADPDLEAEAVQVIQNAYHLAKVTGRRAHLESALDDDAVRRVSRVPGNQASVVFARALEAVNAPPPARASTASGSEYHLGGDYRVTPRPPRGPSNPELTEIAKLLEKRGRYFIAESGPANPRMEDSSRRNSSATVTEFKEHFWQSAADGLLYGAYDSAGQARAAPEGGTSVDGVYLASPGRNVRKVGGAGAGIDAANNVLGGQVKAAKQMRKFAFVHHPDNGTWLVKDISAGYPGKVLPEAQAKETIQRIFDYHGIPKPDFGPVK